MATLAESLVSSSSRPLRLRMRPDLTARKHRYHGRVFWVVKEPVGLNYFRFHEEEFAILQMLDGRASLDEIKEKFEDEFTPQKITFQDLLQFIGMLHRSGLVISEQPGQGRQLKKRGDQKRRQELLSKFSNVFALRFRGIDPDRLLNWLYPRTAWFFSRGFFVIWCLLGLSALLLVGVEFETFHARLPAFHEFFSAQNWIWLGITMAVVKVLHEFGHGLSCKHYGGECHEMGAMLLVFTPALYCNVSDSWMLPNKWNRAAIGAAGMYVEVFLASIATFLWWFSEPGLLNHICLSVMFICSVSTVVFNGNPLLRFDGYYILMDLSEIPNLRQKSTEVVRRFMIELCLGLEQPESPFLPQGNRLLFGLFTVAAVAYRWLVTFSILYFLNKVFEPYGLKVLGQIIALAGLFGLFVQPIWQLGRFFYTPGRMHKVKMPRVYGTLAVATAAVAAFLFVPLPCRVACTLELRPSAAESVYVNVPGRVVEWKVQPGDKVTPGVTLVRLENVDLEREVVDLEGQLRVAETGLANLERLRIHDPTAGLQIAPQREQIVALQKLLQEKTAELDKLQIAAASTGIVIPPPTRPQPRSPDGKLPGWTGSPFDPRNADAAYAEGDLLCLIGEPQVLEAVLVVDQADIDTVRVGDEVRIQLEAYPSQILPAKIEKIAHDMLEASPPALSIQHGGELDTRTDANGVARPLNPSYQARTGPLERGDLLLQVGMRGKAKITTPWRPLGSRVYRYLARTFHFEL
ncbi:MAG: HlyD family efflux transporter periplasmic adaptor subunit [Pirellulales bacterium]